MLVLQSLLTRRLQTAAIFFQRIFCGLRTPFWLSAPGSLAEVSTVHMLRLYPVCKVCHSVGHVSNRRGGKSLAPADSCSFQPRLPKPQIPSQHVFSARMHKPTPNKAWGLITKRRENQNWLLIELPG